jgi:hypothetical protein
LSDQKDRGIDALGSVAQAVRSSTQRLRDEKHDTIAGYVDKAADQIESWSRRLKEKDVDELASDIQQLARRQPAAFVGMAFALGVVSARFLKSSSRERDGYGQGAESRRYQYGGVYGGGMAHDRGTGEPTHGAGVTGVGTELPRPQASASAPHTSTTGSTAGTRAGRARKSPAQTEGS